MHIFPNTSNPRFLPFVHPSSDLVPISSNTYAARYGNRGFLRMKNKPNLRPGSGQGQPDGTTDFLPSLKRVEMRMCWVLLSLLFPIFHCNALHAPAHLLGGFCSHFPRPKARLKTARVGQKPPGKGEQPEGTRKNWQTQEAANKAHTATVQLPTGVIFWDIDSVTGRPFSSSVFDRFFRRT